MSLNLAFFVLLVLVSIYLVIIEVFTILFMLTGLSRTRSFFQVISLLTNSGFTTNESEVIVTSRRRRKLAIIVMIIGNLFNVSVISTLVNISITLFRDPTFDYVQAFVILSIFVLFIIMHRRIPFIKNTLNTLIKNLANRWMFSRTSNPILILDNFHGYGIAEIKLLEVPELLSNKTIFESRISNNFGIRILFIKRGDIYIGDIDDEQSILPHDRVVVFGPIHHITQVFTPH